MSSFYGGKNGREAVSSLGFHGIAAVGVNASYTPARSSQSSPIPTSSSQAPQFCAPAPISRTPPCDADRFKVGFHGAAQTNRSVAFAAQQIAWKSKYSSLKDLSDADSQIYANINGAPSGLEIVNKWSTQSYHHPALAAHAIRRAVRYCVKRKGSKKELRSAPLWDALCKQVASMCRFLDPTAISMCSWALGALECKHDILLRALCVELLQKQRLAEFDSYCLSICAWGFGALDFRDDAIFGMICNQAKIKASTFNPQDISNLVWAMATIKFKDDVMFDIIADESMQKVSQFNAQDLCNVAWAFATNGYHHDQLFEVLAEDCVKKMEMFGALNLVNAVWSFAHMQHFHAGLFRASQHRAPSVLHAMDPQLLGNLLWSFTSFDSVDPDFFKDILTRLAEKPLGFWKPPICAGEHMVKIMNALHPFRHQNTRAFQIMENSFRSYFIDPMVYAVRHVFDWPRTQYESSLEVLQLYQLGEHYSAVGLECLQLPVLVPSGIPKHEQALEKFYVSGGMADRDPEKWGRATPSSHWLAVSLYANINGHTVMAVVPAGPAVEDPERHIRGRRAEEPVIEHNFVSVALKSYGRAHHAEIQALEEVVQRFDSHDLTTLWGRVEIFGTHYPCVSCLGAMWQFSKKFPNIELASSSFEWRLFAKRIRAIPPKDRVIPKREVVPFPVSTKEGGCAIRYVPQPDGSCGQSFYPKTNISVLSHLRMKL